MDELDARQVVVDDLWERLGDWQAAFGEIKGVRWKTPVVHALLIAATWIWVDSYHRNVSASQKQEFLKNIEGLIEHAIRGGGELH